MFQLEKYHVIVLAFTPILFWLCKSILNALKPGLRQIPGPLLAKFTDLWRLRLVGSGNAHIDYPALHEKYGPLVRTAPNVIDIADPVAVPIIYGVTSKYYKSSFYRAFHANQNGTITTSIFSTADPEEHKQQKKSIAQKYSMSSMRSLEYLVDPCSKIFTDAMVELQGEVVDLGTWVQWYAFDVIGAISFSKRFGFMESREDLYGIMGSIESLFKYASIIGQVPWLTSLSENKWLRNLAGDPFPVAAQMVGDSIREYDPKAAREDNRSDFLSFFKQQHEKLKESFTEFDMFTNLIGHLIAGSDTTAISLRAIFYYLIKNKRVYKKLQEEIDQANIAGRLSPTITYAECLELKYLQVVMKEAMRLHPGVFLPLERTVPSGGLTLRDKHFPAGTVVGVNAAVIHRNKDVFGADANEFRPERWLEASKEEIQMMDRCNLTFGGGTRTCIGKHISTMEMGKLVPQVLRQFDIEWASSEPEWKVSTYFFAKQKGLLVRMKERKNVATSS